MNIRLDQSGVISGKDEIENGYATYGKNAMHTIYRGEKSAVSKINAGSVAMEFGGILSDNGMNAYAGNDLAVSNNLSENLKMRDQQQNYMILMSNTVSDKDLGRVFDEGFDISEMDPEETVTVVDEIKAKMAESGVIIEGYNDNLSQECLEETVGSIALASQIAAESSVIARALENYELPSTKDNIESISRIANLSTMLGEINSSAMIYMLKNNLPPTVENIYTAEFSGSSSERAASGGYYSNNGFLAKKGSDSQLEAVIPQIKEVIEKAGFESSQAMTEDGKWMIENGIELTPVAFERMQEIKSLSLPLSFEEGANIAAAALKNTGSVANAVPGHYQTVISQAIQKIDELDSLIDKEKSLIEEQLKEEPIKDDPLLAESENSSQSFSQLSHYRQLQETRLVMSISNTSFLIRNNININFNNLEELVDNLKTAENVIREKMFNRGSVEENNKAADIYDYTQKVVRDIPKLPATVIGFTAKNAVSLEQIHEEGISLKLKYEKAGQGYEALMTEVRKDLGDSISKAFERVGSLLEENGIEPTKENEKAARILGYNEMAITRENIDMIRDANQKLSRVLGKMQPAAVLSLIRDGINPVTMDLDELEARLNERQRNDDKEKYSSFLVNLEERGEITAGERSGYIGIYRMLHQIETKDSAAIGALLSQGGEMTLGNLLTQVRNRKAGGMDAKIDDSFGLLEKTVSKGRSITDQIFEAFKKDNTAEKFVNLTLSGNGDNTAEDFRNIENLLESGDIPLNNKNIQGAGALIKDKGIVIRNVKKLLSKNSDNNDKNDISDEVPGFIKDVLDSFTDSSSAKEAYSKMVSDTENMLDEGIFYSDSTAEIRDINYAINAMGVASLLARNEHFIIPMEIGGEEGSISVHLVHSNRGAGEVRIFTETESLGRISATFTSNADGLEGYVESDRQATINNLKDKGQELSENLGEKGITITALYFNQNINTGLVSDNEKTANGDLVSHESSANLYKVAKEFIEVMAK